MPSILKGPLAKTVSRGMEAAQFAYDLTLTRTETSGGGPYDPTGGTTTTTTYPARGWVENYDDDARDGTLIDQRDVRVVVLVDSIEIVPTDSTDTITIDQRSLTVIAVQRDASGALFSVQARS